MFLVRIGKKRQKTSLRSNAYKLLYKEDNRTPKIQRGVLHMAKIQKHTCIKTYRNLPRCLVCGWILLLSEMHSHPADTLPHAWLQTAQESGPHQLVITVPISLLPPPPSSSSHTQSWGGADEAAMELTGSARQRGLYMKRMSFTPKWDPHHYKKEKNDLLLQNDWLHKLNSSMVLL